MTQEKTLVVGLGEVGGALAEFLERTMPVLRHDLEPVDIEEPVGIMHLCFPFQNREQFENASLAYIRRFRPVLIIINSTVLPGTTRSIANHSGAAVAYSPVRGKHAHMVDDLARYTKFVAAGDVETARLVEEHFRRAGMQTRRINRIETLEIAKLAETTYFGVLIGFAQELNRYCERVDADYYEATQFFEEIDFLPSARYFPGFIGGHCVIPNIHLLLQLAGSPLLEAILDSNRRRRAELEGSSHGASDRSGPATADAKLLADR